MNSSKFLHRLKNSKKNTEITATSLPFDIFTPCRYKSKTSQTPDLDNNKPP